MANKKSYDDYKIENIIKYTDDKYISNSKIKDYDSIINNQDYYEINDVYSDKLIKKRSLSNNLYSTPYSTPPATTRSPINWGSDPVVVNSENAFVQPSADEVKRVLDAMNMVDKLPTEQQRMVVEATREIRYFIDGHVRSRFGATQHFNAIRCLNDPTRTDISRLVSVPGSPQLAGEEFFALNRFMANYPDIADIQWWSVYNNGSWGLDTWNPEGEHLDTGYNGWGELVGSVIKLNGHVLTPPEVVGLHRTLKLRDLVGFMTPESFDKLKILIRALNSEGSLPRRFDEQLELAHDLGLVGPDGKSLTYQGSSMIDDDVRARVRKERQLSVTDENTRRIIVPTIFN